MLLLQPLQQLLLLLLLHKTLAGLTACNTALQE
jgi:hypothetical protein